MALRETEVKTYRLTYDCDECGEEMVFTGYSFSQAINTKYYHKCANGHELVINNIHYPRTTYK